MDTVKLPSWKDVVNVPTKVQAPTFKPNEKREAIVDAFKYAWHAYERDAMGSDEYHPISHKGQNISNSGGFGYTILDTLDTMYLMGLTDEIQRTRDWVEKNLSFDRFGTFSTFETTIRVLGGLLSAYHLSGNDALYLTKAIDLGDRLMAAFDTSSGLPTPSVNFRQRSPVHETGAHDRLSTAEAATLQLEFKYLSLLTGKEEYWRKAENVMKMVYEALKAAPEYNDLVPIYMSIEKATFIRSDIRLGSRGDSYYEYLLKQYLQTNGKESIYKKMYEESMQGLHDKLVHKTYRQGLTYIAELVPHGRCVSSPSFQVAHKQDHLVCFLAGSLMLGATTVGAKKSQIPSVPPLMSELRATGQRDWNTGVELLETCMKTYLESETGLSPEIAMFKADESLAKQGDADKDWYIKNWRKGARVYDARYMLRPETTESVFLAWRLTKDVKYQDYAWAIFSAIEKHCKLPDGGYATLLDVNTLPVALEDKQETFFLSETLKYLYLTFADDDVVPLSKYVFNTEAHPLPVFDPHLEPKFVGKAP
ncbi:glycoside hydrolase family 47 protein [Cylindrobasidium torrendii FP15055 ss-10]|uniref:alpha-1,2-Mannosidase n=1 Tax=Cylindrobasidium torrendii FP15055 ss-10 TaxID=1314674 RepID=A0A0D7BGK2_9AGAR|nr:glycoside hydrolase family 47 protein [Cylindrobasidium torrendii FP15055 ss-10]